MKIPTPIAILGVGNIGGALARGLVSRGGIAADKIYVTRRTETLLGQFSKEGFRTSTENGPAVKASKIIVLAVGPSQLDELLQEIAPDVIAADHLVVSIVSGASIASIRAFLPAGVEIVRAMPNTAIALGESMTCVAGESSEVEGLSATHALFQTVGKTLPIAEEQMTAATALCACGIAFFLRAIRAASQGGIEIGFHSEEAYTMASQTARGAASLLLEMESHPESEIDRVTTPLGCTISGLNEMEHRGFSSALIKGIVRSAEKAGQLYLPESD